MSKKVYKNVILFIVGFCLYITIEVLFRGYSYPLMGVSWSSESNSGIDE